LWKPSLTTCRFELTGHVVGDFNGYFIPASTVTKDQFLSAVNKNA
jgi:hypothetical protein